MYLSINSYAKIYSILLGTITLYCAYLTFFPILHKLFVKVKRSFTSYNFDSPRAMDS